MSCVHSDIITYKWKHFFPIHFEETLPIMNSAENSSPARDAIT